MCREALRFDVTSFNVATSACEKGVSWQCVEPFLDAMPRGCMPLNVIFDAAISACEKGGQWPRMAPLVNEMPRVCLPLVVISFDAAMSACRKSGQWQRVPTLLDEMQNGSPSPDVISFSAAISMCEKGGQRQHVMPLFDETLQRCIQICKWQCGYAGIRVGEAGHPGPTCPDCESNCAAARSRPAFACN
eukprot:10429599-Karenia_brevis.AAC.1